MKKLLSILLVFMLCFSFLGCATSKPKTYVHGDWEVIYNEDGTCTIYDFSKEGKQKEVLVFPEEVAGREVIGTYYEPSGYYTDGHRMYSSKLRKLFFTKHFCLDRGALEVHIRPLKVIYNYELIEHFSKSCNPSDFFWTGKYYYRSKFYYNNFFEGMDLNSQWLYYINNVVSNVSYYYNYESAPDDGYYWIDDYDEELITFIPENPIREGYEFCGWYKEPECINVWDFNNDLVPKKEYSQSGVYIYKETKLYAGWKEIK